MAAFVYPSNAELQEIAQEKQAVLTQDDPIFGEMPIVEVESHLLEWEQEDNFTGLQQVRGLNNQFGRVKNVGGKRFRMEPGVYGEYAPIDEEELTARRQWGNPLAPISIADLVMRRQDYLLNRRIDRIRYIGWTLLAAGTFSVSNADGTVVHTDTFPLQTYAAGVAWSTVATATPLADFRAIKLKSRGKGCSFGGQAKAYMNQTTFNNFISNTNQSDLAGRRTDGLSTVLSLSMANALLLGEDLPQIVIYDEGYLDEAGAFQLFIPNGKAVVVGRRPGGQKIMDYAMTRNANNPGLAPGAYMDVVESARPPKHIEVFDGHNGGVRIYYPSAVVIASV
jgi:hypothetical protein